jgi:6-phosphogluconolactonase
MGEDGHFASLFPDFEDLEEALDPESRDQCVMVRTAGSPYLRISLTLSALLDSNSIVLLFFGQAKRRVFEAAAAGASNYPVAALLAQDTVPVTVIWAP